jgi:hypothetical protein
MDFEIVAEGLQFPEGPIALPDGSIVLVEIARGTLTRVWNGRTEVQRCRYARCLHHTVRNGQVGEDALAAPGVAAQFPADLSYARATGGQRVAGNPAGLVE